MGADDTEAGRLVRLADVLRWLGQYPNPKPHKAALAALCDAMPDDVMQWLYRVQPGDYAKPVPPVYMFSYLTLEEIAVSKDKAWRDNAQRMHEAQRGGRFPGLAILNGKISTVEAKQSATQAIYEPTEPGLPALLKRIKSYWANEVFNSAPAIDNRGEYLTFLAIPLEKAMQHWGWGHVAEVVTLQAVSQSATLPTTWADFVRYRKENPGHSWTQDMRKILCAEEKRRNEAGHSGVRKSMADEFGDMTSSGLGDQIRKASSGTKSGRGRKAA